MPTPTLDWLERFFFLLGAVAGFISLTRGPATTQAQRIFRLATVATALLGLLVVFVLKRRAKSRSNSPHQDSDRPNV